MLDLLSYSKLNLYNFTKFNKRLNPIEIWLIIIQNYIEHPSHK